MIKFYYNTGPNPMKIALFLEEVNLDYEAIPIDTRKFLIVMLYFCI